MSAFKVRADRCKKCTDWNLEKCFCVPITTASTLQVTKDELSKYVEDAVDEGYKKIDAIMKQSTILTDPHQSDRLTNKNHIDFIPTNDADLAYFNGLMKDELKLRHRDDRQKLARATGSVIAGT